MSKKPLKFYFSLLCGKITIKLLKMLKKNATNMPGSVMLAICPDFLKYLEKPENIIAITGTNGKTTVSNMILDILTDNGYDCTNNNFGGNVETGITTALVKDSTLSGKPKKKYCVLEVDERSAVRIYPYITPNYLICTNLTRDSFKRNAHVEFIYNILNDYIPDKTHLILNADDLISSRLKLKNKRTYFGMQAFDGEELVPDNIVKDITVCPECNSPLRYSFLRYNHIGRAVCTGCGYSSPVPDFDAVERHFNSDGRAKLVIKTSEGMEEYNVPCENIINLYNATATTAVLRTFGLTYEQVKKSFEKINVVQSRFSIYEKNGITLRSILSKGQNPVACSHACNIARSKEDAAVIMIWDDLYDTNNTSENSAWIYDVDLEFLNCDNVKQIVVGGKRANDFVLRLLIAGVPEEKIKFTLDDCKPGELVDIEGIKNIFILFDLFNVKQRMTAEKIIKEKMENANRNTLS